MDDGALVTAVLAGDPAAWPAFQARFERLILSCIRKALGCYAARSSPEDIEDLVSGVCLNIIKDDYRKLRMFDPRRGYRLSSWVGLIATNTVIDALRRRDPRPVSLDEPGAPGIDAPSGAPDPEAHLASAEEAEILAQALARLSASDRLFLEYTLDYELDPVDLARQMQVAVATIYSRKNKVREKLRKHALTILAASQEGSPTGRVRPKR
ncbi:MAG TPA: sigma-70 family RNA polymerase sigma factor [Polyangia bacterium]